MRIVVAVLLSAFLFGCGESEDDSAFNHWYNIKLLAMLTYTSSAETWDVETNGSSRQCIHEVFRTEVYENEGVRQWFHDSIYSFDEWGETFDDVSSLPPPQGLKSPMEEWSYDDVLNWIEHSEKRPSDIMRWYRPFDELYNEDESPLFSLALWLYTPEIPSLDESLRECSNTTTEVAYTLTGSHDQLIVGNWIFDSINCSEGIYVPLKPIELPLGDTTTGFSFYENGFYKEYWLRSGKDVVSTGQVTYRIRGDSVYFGIYVDNQNFPNHDGWKIDQLDSSYMTLSRKTPTSTCVMFYRRSTKQTP